MTLLAALLAFVIGITLGMLGGGGSILTVPVFVYVMGYDPKVAIAMSLPVVGGAALVGAVKHWHMGHVDLRMAVPFGAAAMIAAYGGARLLEQVLVSLQAMLLDTSAMTSRAQLSLGASRFLDPDTASAGMLTLLQRVDPFTIWVTILLGIGISVVGKVPREKGMLAAALLWLVGSVPALITLMVT
jgi:Sulfite exporter TauE/SafE.